MRGAFQVESLEQRLLLSADPAAATVQMLAGHDGQELQYAPVIPQQPKLQDGAVSFHADDSPQTQWDAADPASTDFAVDAQAFSQALAQTRAAFMDSAMAVADQPYARFMDGVLGADALSLTPDSSADGDALRLSVPQSTALDPASVLRMPNEPVQLHTGAQAQALAPGKTSQATDYVLGSGHYDAAQLAQDVGLSDARALVVQPGATLGGSGTLALPVEVSGQLAPGYSPGVDNVSSLTLGNAATTVIELGGATAGTGTGHYDQVNVSGTAQLDGSLQVALWGGFVPQDGQVFTFLTFGTASGGFSDASGLVDAQHGLYYEVKQTSNALQLVAHSLDATTAFLVDKLSGSGGLAAGSSLVGGLNDDDVVGMALNAGYFAGHASAEITGSLDLGSGLSFSGTLSLARQAQLTVGGTSYAAWKLGLDHASGYFGLGTAGSGAPGVAFSDANVAMLWLDSPSSDAGWIWAKGTAGGLTLQGGSGVGLSAASLSLDFASGLGTGNDAMLDLSAIKPTVLAGTTSYTFDSSVLAERTTLSGNLTLSLAGGLSVAGNVGMSTSDAGLLMAGSGVTASMSAAGVTLSLSNGSFGLVILADKSGYTLQADASTVTISGGSFASVGASSASLSVNTSGAAQAARTLQFGNFSYSIGAMAAQALPVLRVTGLHATLGGTFTLAGDFAFQQSTGGDMQALASGASVSMAAGGAQAGVKNTEVALVIQSGGGALLEAAGTFDASLGSDVQLSAGAAAVRWNSTSGSASGRQLSVAGATHTFGTLGAGLQEVALTGASLVAGDFFRVGGDFAFHRSTMTAKLAADTLGTAANEASDGLLMDLLTLGGQGLSASAGLAGGVGLQLAGVQFGLVLMSAREDTSRRWSTLQAKSTGVDFKGLSGFKASGSNLALSLNTASQASDAVVDYASGKTALSVSTGAGNLAVNLDGSKGKLLELRGDLTVDVTGFVQLSGSLGFSVQGQGASQQLVAVGTSVSAVLSAGSSASVSLNNASFGLRVGTAGDAVFELGNGTLNASIDGLANVSASSVEVRYTGASASVTAGTKVSVGSQ
ncbi:LEPR-XLL domain-containing protein, partial [Azohydromonas lata]|uniref:LEPR-XLL domain-containing protein n=1 Tax=Azohydromonas lata TaxID=45677 RepID=UPI0014709172